MNVPKVFNAEDGFNTEDGHNWFYVASYDAQLKQRAGKMEPKKKDKNIVYNKKFSSLLKMFCSNVFKQFVFSGSSTRCKKHGSECCWLI
ncbi:hypothetical protein CEXT_347761 [Caerostris extrusa]|uniref:Uncharacterized protein n=1 Tax=Caerostris extrusa TaxID=172846 RepID=A0AAV4MEM8_CAEEX|nr:hypothetical protein CEXT_347761 [Caerostris extrusa]